jgi:hypothetical protein
MRLYLQRVLRQYVLHLACMSISTSRRKLAYPQLWFVITLTLDHKSSKLLQTSLSPDVLIQFPSLESPELDSCDVYDGWEH